MRDATSMIFLAFLCLASYDVLVMSMDLGYLLFLAWVRIKQYSFHRILVDTSLHSLRSLRGVH
jgi:hypothetical protein